MRDETEEESLEWYISSAWSHAGGRAGENGRGVRLNAGVVDVTKAEPSTVYDQQGLIVIGGYTMGNPFDALIVGCYDGGKPQVRQQGEKRLCPAHALRVVRVVERISHREVSVWQSTREAPRPLGA